MIVVCGPTGSGKSTTLYASVMQMNRVEQKIITIENPVEYHMPDCNQMQVQPEVGVTFASQLRSILRLDPDVIVVGEIRDQETAEIATEAALTGHLVLTTVHAAPAAGPGRSELPPDLLGGRYHRPAHGAHGVQRVQNVDDPARL